MSAPITEFVDITINVEGASADKFAFGALMGVFPQTVNANRQNGPYFSVAELNAAGFTVAAEPEANAWATDVFAQGNGVDRVIIGTEDVGDATMTATLDAIEAVDEDSWYITNIYTRSDADIEAAAAWVLARKKIFIAQSSDAGILAGTPANVALNLQAAANDRTALLYYQTDADYADGAWSSVGGGFNLDAPDGAGIWAYKPLTGIPFTEITGAEATEIYDANANLYGRNVGLQFTSKGTTAAGAPTYIDVTVTTDWLEKRTQEAIITAFVATKTKIPFTNAGIAMIGAAVKGVLDLGVSAGHISPDVPVQLRLPDISEVSTDDKGNRLLTISADLTYAGAIQKVALTYNVQF